MTSICISSTFITYVILTVNILTTNATSFNLMDVVPLEVATMGFRMPYRLIALKADIAIVK